MNVPIPERQVGVQAVGFDRPQIQPITPAASGANIGEAAAGLGQSLERAGGEASQAWITKARMDAEANAFRAFVGFSAEHSHILHSVDPATGQLDTDLKTGKPLGVLDRSGADAAGASQDYQARTAALLDKTQGAMQSPYERHVFEQMARRTISYGVDTVNGHETAQSRVYHEQAANAAVNAKAQLAAAVAATPAALADMATDAGAIAINHARNGEGIQDAAILDQRAREVHDKVIETAVMSRVNDDPQKARDLLADARVRSQMSAVGLERLDKTVEGKWLELRAHALSDTLIPTAMDRDGAVDLAKVQAGVKAAATSLPVPQQQALQDMVRSRVGVYEQQFREKKQLAEDRFNNAALDLYAKHVPYDQAHDQLFKGPQAYQPVDNIDIKGKEDWMIAVWSGQKEKALAAMTPDKKEAIAEAQNAAKGYFGNTQIQLAGEDFKRNPVDLFNRTLEDKAIMNRWSAAQIQQYAKDTLQKVPTGDQRIFRSVITGGLPWSHKEEGIKVQADLPQLQDSAIRQKAAARIAAETHTDATPEQVDAVIRTAYGSR